MSEDSTSAGKSVGDSIILFAAIVIVISGAKLASAILVPFLLSLFITIILLVPVETLIKRGVPAWLSLLIVVAVMLVFFAGVFIIVGTASANFSADLPTYQSDLLVLVSDVSAWFDARGIDVSASGLKDAIDPARMVSFFQGFLGDIGGALSGIMLVVFIVIFMLTDANLFSRKIGLHQPEHHEAERLLGKLSALVASLSTYAKIKAAVSLLTGILIWSGLSLIGVKYPVLWGLLAFLLNFIPTIGSIIAAFPVLLLALLSLDPVLLLMIIGLYLSVNIIVGNFVEPVWMGGEVGLSTLAVFLSMVFWGWLFGPVGMLLSVPLTVAVKYYASIHPRTEWLALLLSNKAEHAAIGTNPGVDDRGAK